jgi:VCBS repeat-containing protein
LTFGTATITARGALIYNNSKSNAAIAVLDFGSDFSSSNGTFQVQFPTAAHNTALIRIS